MIKRYFNKRSKEYFYYTYFIKYEGFDFIELMCNLKTDKKLSYIILNSKNELLNLKVKNVLKKYGKPFFKEISKIDKLHIAYFYNFQFSKYDILKSFHFYNNKLFFVNITFKELAEADKQKIINKMKDVYNISCDSITKIKIQDAAGNIFYIEDLFDLSFNLLLGGSSFLQTKKETAKQQNEINIKEEDKFLTELFKNIV